MISNKKQRILKGITDGLFDTITGYPRVLTFYAFKPNIQYTIDLIKKEITPKANLPKITTQVLLKDLPEAFENLSKCLPAVKRGDFEGAKQIAGLKPESQK